MYTVLYSTERGRGPYCTVETGEGPAAPVPCRVYRSGGGEERRGEEQAAGAGAGSSTMAYGTTDAVVGPRSEEEVTPLTQEEEVEGHVEGAVEVEVEVEAESDASEGAGATPSSSSSSSSSYLGGKVATFMLFSGAMVSMVTMPQLFGTPFGTKDSTGT